MRIVITGICGFVGSELALQLRERFSGAAIAGIDNFSRPGSETTRPRLTNADVGVKHGDVRCASDIAFGGPPPTLQMPSAPDPAWICLSTRSARSNGWSASRT